MSRTITAKKETEEIPEVVKKIDLEPLRRYTEEDLREVNRFVVYLIRQKQLVSSIHAAATFCVGDKVWFIPRGGRHAGRRFEGEVERVNVKTVQVKTPGMNWKVAPTLLNHME